MSAVITPNMQLIVPGVGNEAGPTYASDINNSLTIIDGHNHSVGSGVQITPSGLNINSSLTMNNNSLTNIAALTLFPQGSAPANDSLYVSGTDLYFVDGAGNNIRVTQSGSVAGSSGTITGLPSGTASAAFAAGTFTFQAATNTAANIDGASFIFRNNTASSFGVTVAPPNSLGSNYALVLPAVPAQTNVMTLDSSGNMGSTTWNDVANNRTRASGTTVAVGGVAISSSSGFFSTASTSYVDVTNLNVTITTAGRPVQVSMISDGSAAALISTNPSVGTNIKIVNVTSGASWVYEIDNSNAQTLFIIDTTISASAGTYNYKIQAENIGGGGLTGVTHYVLTAYEL